LEIGQRAYGPDSTADETAAIASRVSVVGERVLLVHEIPVQSPFSINLMFDRIEDLTRDWDRFSYIADLTAARRPDPETRAALKRRVLGISPRVAHVGIVVGNNLLMRAMARLLAHGMGLLSVSVHATVPEAIEETAGEMGR
jgi:hypothetical protein